MMDQAGLTRLQATKPKTKKKSPFLSAVKEPNQRAARIKQGKLRKPIKYQKDKRVPPGPLQTHPRTEGVQSAQAKKFGSSRA